MSNTDGPSARASGEIPGGGWTPVPDPTKLTTEQLRRELDQATTELRREMESVRLLLATRLDAMDATSVTRLANLNQAIDGAKDDRDRDVRALRDLIEARLDAMESATGYRLSVYAALPAQIDADRERDVAALKEVLETRLAAMDKATELRLEVVRALPAEAREQITHLRQLLEEKFTGIALQFGERDVRSEQATEGAKQALDAALLAQKELVAQQNEANSAAAAKAEASFTKQIDQIGTIIQTLEKALDARITELKERIDRGEGQTAGGRDTRTEQLEVDKYGQADRIAVAATQRATISIGIAALSALVTVIAVIFAIVHG